MAQTWWLRKLVDLNRDGILNPMQPLIQDFMLWHLKKKKIFCERWTFACKCQILIFGLVSHLQTNLQNFVTMHSLHNLENCKILHMLGVMITASSKNVIMLILAETLLQELNKPCLGLILLFLLFLLYHCIFQLILKWRLVHCVTFTCPRSSSPTNGRGHQQHW